MSYGFAFNAGSRIPKVAKRLHCDCITVSAITFPARSGSVQLKKDCIFLLNAVLKHRKSGFRLSSIFWKWPRVHQIYYFSKNLFDSAVIIL